MKIWRHKMYWCWPSVEGQSVLGEGSPSEQVWKVGGGANEQVWKQGPPCEQTDGTENITFPKTTCAGSKNIGHATYCSRRKFSQFLDQGAVH